MNMHTRFALIDLSLTGRFDEILDEFERRTERKSIPYNPDGREYLVLGYTDPDLAFREQFLRTLHEIEPEQATHIGLQTYGRPD